MLFQFNDKQKKDILYSPMQPAIRANFATTVIFPQRPLFSPENSPYICTHLYAHIHLVKKEEAAKICRLSGLVVQVFFFWFSIFYLIDV